MSFIKCLNAHKSELQKNDIASLRSAAAKYRKAGSSPDEAAKAAFKDVLAEAVSDYNKDAGNESLDVESILSEIDVRPDENRKEGDSAKNTETSKKKPELKAINGGKSALSRKSLARERAPASLRFRFTEKQLSRIYRKLGLSSGISV